MDFLSLSKDEIIKGLPELPSYRAGQIFAFLHAGKEFNEMTSLPVELRESLTKSYIAQPVHIEKCFESKDKTKKYLFRLADGNLIEGVLMSYSYGNTLCVSSQVGCRMGCAFCASGLDGRIRNLTAGEILGQIVQVNRANGGDLKTRAVTNVVMMGSGEPFDNYENVVKFFDILRDEKGINISERNISLSTCGLADKIKKFANDGYKVTLTISLHAPNDEIRERIMPVSKKYPIKKLLEAAKYYFEKTGRRVVFEYSLINGVNDSKENAKELASILRGFPTHINIIRLNEVKEINISGSTKQRSTEFLAWLEEAGASATIRRTLGTDVAGACGQLRRGFLKFDE